MLDVLEECIDATLTAAGSAHGDAHQGISLLLEIIEEPQALLQASTHRVVQLALKTTCSRDVDLELRSHACQARTLQCVLPEERAPRSRMCRMHADPQLARDIQAKAARECCVSA
jgi:hypothetical protein